MKANVQAQLKLVTLVQNGCLPASQCSGAFLKLIAPLLHSGVLAWARSGAGRKLVIKDAAALSNFRLQHFPEAIVPAGTGSRIESVARFRDTKTLRNDSLEIISVRVWHDGAILKNGCPVGGAAATAAHGVFSFLLTPNSHYELRGACALVENPAVFAVIERFLPNFDLAIYGHGRISNRTVDWLAQAGDPSFKLLHLPDYDPVGLSEFQRLHSRLGDCIALHLPDDLETRFARFSNHELVEKSNSQAMLAQLRRSNLPAIRRVVELIDRHNAGLEQEALLLH